MDDARFAALTDRALVSLTGEDTTGFLQGLVTNDVSAVSEERAIYAALLTPQGKYLHDFFVVSSGGALFLECEARRIADLIARLSRYRLRARVAIEDASDRLKVFAVFGEDALQRVGLAAREGSAAPLDSGRVFVDPRSAALGARALLPGASGAATLQGAGLSPSDREPYDTLRMSLGIAAGDPEIEPDKSYPMEYGFDALNGISFSKGCYVGQEVTVRMKTRGLVRKRLVPVRIDGDTPETGAPLQLDGKAAGELRAACGPAGLALVRVDVLEQALAEGVPFAAGTTLLYPMAPS